MKLNSEEENILKNIRTGKSMLPAIYILMGGMSLLFSLSGLFFKNQPVWNTVLVFFGGFLTGSGIEKLYNKKIKKISLKLHEDFKARNRT